MRYAYLILAFVTVLAVGVLGFRGSHSTKPPLEVFADMDRQPKLQPQDHSVFFADGRSDRPLPTGVISANFGPLGRDLVLEGHYATGKNADGSFAAGLPAQVEINASLLSRGRNRFEIYCAPCHGVLGDGQGITTQYGMNTVAANGNYHTDRLRQMPDGEIFNTITHGKNTMLPYGDKLSVEDRWAVVAYVRALQRSHQGTAADVPAAHRQELGLP